MRYNYKLAGNTISNNDIDLLAEWLKTYPPLTMASGGLTKKFEEEWSKKVGVKYSIFCNSGSSANLLAYSALLNLHPELKKSFTALCTAGWATTISPTFQLGLNPVLIDVDPTTFGMSIDILEEKLKKREGILLVVLVSTLGFPPDIYRIMELQKKYGFLLFEDACPAVGSKYDNKYIGTFGDVGTFSFYYGHQISTIEGGMVCTNHESIYEELLMLRSHGWAKDLGNSSRGTLEKTWNVSEHSSLFTFYNAGYNLRPTEINSFLGLRQINILDKIAKKRHENFIYYLEKFRDSNLITQKYPLDGTTVSCITFPFIAKNKDISKEVRRKLIENGIETRPISGGSLGLQPVWYMNKKNFFSQPFANLLHNNGFVLPCHPEISFDDIDNICNKLFKQ